MTRGSVNSTGTEEIAKMDWKAIGILLILFMDVGFAGIHAQEKKGVLEPETANEARLNRLQPPDQVMDAVGVKPDMVVAEIGAGQGRYVVQLATRVGENGKVYAEDIDEDALRHCKGRCERGGLDNVETIVGDLDDPKLPAGEIDLIFIISSYGHFSDPVTLMKNARPALRPDGYVAIVEWLPRDGRLAGEGSPEEVEAQMKAAGYRLERTDPLLKANRMMIYVFRREGV
jgi:SAM-dependent methyltransferase